MNIAHISPNQNAYSETFVQAHRNGFEGDVKYYYGGALPTSLDGIGVLKPSFLTKLKFNIKELFGKTSPVNYLTGRALAESFKRNKIDVVYAEYAITGVGILNICKELNIPFIVNFHGYDATVKEILKAYEDDYKWLFEYASKIVVVSKSMCHKLEELGCPSHKLVYTPCAPSDRFFSLEPTYSENSFLSVGRFVDKKAPYYSILAFQKVVEKHPDAKLYMIGDGILLNACENLVNYLGLSRNIIFEGAKQQSEILPYFLKVKGLVQHSIEAASGDSEGTPVAILEAGAAALPVVSTRHAGIKDVVVEGKTGLLVDEHDVDGMAQNMMCLLENQDRVKEMGENARRHIRENYNMQIHMEKINKVVKDSLKI